MQNKIPQFAINLLLSKLRSVFNAKTDTQLAECLGVKQNTISSWRTRCSVDYSLIIAKCDNLNVDLNWLFNEKIEEIIFHSKYAENVIKKNDDKVDDNFDDIPNVQKMSSIEKTFNSKCAENALKKNDSKINSEIDGFPNMQKTPSIEKTSDSKCLENLTLLNGRDNNTGKSNNRNVQEILPIETDYDTSCVSIPVVDVSVAAGGGYPNGDYCDTLGVIRLPKSMISPGNLLCLKVDGQSMEPTIRHGSRVIVRHIEPSDWSYSIKSGNVFVVVDRFGDSCIKRIDNQLRTKGELILKSDNSDKRSYATFSVAASDITHIWAIEYYIATCLPDAYEEINERFSNMEDDMVSMKSMIQDLIKRP